MNQSQRVSPRGAAEGHIRMRLRRRRAQNPPPTARATTSSSVGAILPLMDKSARSGSDQSTFPPAPPLRDGRWCGGRRETGLPKTTTSIAGLEILLHERQVPPSAMQPSTPSSRMNSNTERPPPASVSIRRRQSVRGPALAPAIAGPRHAENGGDPRNGAAGAGGRRPPCATPAVATGRRVPGQLRATHGAASAVGLPNLTQPTYR